MYTGKQLTFVCEFCILETCYNCLLVSGILMSFLRFPTNHAISKWRPFKFFSLLPAYLLFPLSEWICWDFRVRSNWSAEGRHPCLIADFRGKHLVSHHSVRCYWQAFCRFHYQVEKLLSISRLLRVFFYQVLDFVKCFSCNCWYAHVAFFVHVMNSINWFLNAEIVLHNLE